VEETMIDDFTFRPSTSNAILRMVDQGEISYAGAKEVFRILCSEGGTPEDIVARHGLRLSATKADLSAAIDKVLHDNPKQAESARTNPKLAGWIVGQVISATGHKASPKDVAAMVAHKLEETT
jgi:aspartyl-tRNA(Asn)/glutamyl-tRNA(Gln) amidotransferase subunit B